jgi:hypothetical protein
MIRCRTYLGLCGTMVNLSDKVEQMPFTETAKRSRPVGSGLLSRGERVWDSNKGHRSCSDTLSLKAILTSILR